VNETEKLTVGALVSALALVVTGFLFHVAPRFPGSLTGSLIGIAGAVLLILLLVYSVVKRSAWVKARVTKHVALGAILSFHIYAGVIGALLGIIHSGHKFYSPLGIGLVSAMLVVVFSGFVGRYYLMQVGTDLREQQSMLAMLRRRYDAVAGAVAGGPAPAALADVPLPGLLGAIAELEYAIGAREVLKRTLSRWTILHVGAAILMYSLLALHIWNGIYYGLRWVD
jgi:ABC-type transport system involved in cytochrome c biogenesis permease subunit